MKKMVWLGRAAMILSVVAIPLAIPAHAASPNAAVHIDNTGCILLDGNGAPTAATADRTVVTSSGNGNLNCTAQVTPSASGHAATFDFASTGLLCSVPGGGFTDKWHETVSASGNATLSCHSKS